jgi:molecular chaperone GrpE
MINLTMTDQPEPNQPVEPVNESPTEERIKSLERLNAEHLDGWKRAKADYLNLKKQTDKEKQEIAQFAVAQTILHFLPMYDNLNLAIKHIPEDEQRKDWVKGIIHIRKQYTDALDTMGLKIIPTVGEQFDPAKHHAISKTKREGMNPGTIVEEVKAGFMAENRVLAPASVIVAE